MTDPVPAHDALDPLRWWTLVVVCISTLILLLDVSAVNVALADIQADLGASFQQLQWVVDAYAITLAALMLTAGALADRIGRRRVFCGGIVLFVIASLLCGLSTSATALNGARALQGIGGAAMFATTLALLAAGFEGKDRATAFGVWAGMSGASIALGPVVGGVLVEHVSWQSIFLVNIPIGALALAIALRTVRESKDPDAGRVDIGGLVTFSAALFLLIFALVRGNDEGWTSGAILACLVGAVLLLVAFVAVELRHERPMLDLSLFRKPAFAGVAIAAFALSASIFATFPYLTLYLQNTLGYSPLEAGLRFLPFTILSFLCAVLAGRLMPGLQTRFLLAVGLGALGIGLLLMARLHGTSGWTALLAGFLVAGAGVGLANPAVAATAVGVVDPRRAGMAVGINNTFRQVGIATGIAGLGALLQSGITDRVRDQVGAGVRLPAAEVLAQGSPSVLGDAPQAYATAFTGALNEIFVITGIIALVGAVLALVLVRRRDFVVRTQPPVAHVDSEKPPLQTGVASRPLD